MGHYVLRLEGRDRSYLFASDLVFWGGAIILQNVPDSNLQQYAASMNRAAELEFDALLPGHHMISLENGRRHVLAAANDFNRIGLPRDLLR
jgi:glyoxylase-like metal-dependent hydrolase (beta-lactamase superfamily II)